MVCKISAGSQTYEPGIITMESHLQDDRPSFVTNCHVFRGAQLANTDHHMFNSRLKLKLKANPTAKHKPHFDLTHLSDTKCHAFAPSTTGTGL